MGPAAANARSVVPAPDPAPEHPILGSVTEIQAYVAGLPDLDPRTPDETLGYDAAGLPH